MPLSTYIVEIDWIGDGAFTGTSDDVTANVNGAEWRRGRDYASQLIGRSRSGKSVINLMDVDGTYMSFNTDSPITGKIVPSREVRIQMDGTVVWHGYLQTIKPAPKVKGVNAVRVDAQGAIGLIGGKKVSVPQLVSVTTTTALGTVLAQAGLAAGSYTTGTAQSTMARYWASDEPVTRAIEQIEATEAGFVYETKGAGIHFEGRHDRFASPATTSQATWTDDPNGTKHYSRIQQSDPSRFIYNGLEAVVRGYSTGTGTILWQHPEAGVSDNPALGVDQKKTFWAVHPTPTSDNNIIGVAVWETPTSGVHYVTNSSTAGTGTDLSGDMKLTTTKFGDRMKMEFENTGTQDAYFTTLEASGSALISKDPVVVSEDDTVSQTTYGERTFRNPSEFISDSGEADSWVKYHIGIYADPVPIVSIAFDTHRSGSHQVEARTRDISDRITIQATGSAGLGFNQDFFIEAETHRVTRDRRHTVTWDCSPVGDFAGFWVLDVSQLNLSSRLAY